MLLAGSWPFPIRYDVPLNSWRWHFEVWRACFPWFRELGEREKRYVGLSDIPKYFEYVSNRMEPPGSEGSLGHIIDIVVEAPAEMHVEWRGPGKTENGASKRKGHDGKLTRFFVTLRSNHVTPGWKFNSESVRWYIDDVNATVRTIPWISDERERGPQLFPLSPEISLGARVREPWNRTNSGAESTRDN
jgi:hypothetical protein